MIRSPRARTAAVAVTGALVGALGLAGCGAGQIAATSEQVAAVGGANITAGQIAVRDAAIAFDGPAAAGSAYEAGGDAPLVMSIVNQGAEADRLVSVSSPVASGVEFTGTREIPGGQVLVVEGASVAPAEDAPEEESGAEATGTAAPEDDEAGATATPAATVDGAPQARIVLTGLREAVRPGLNYVLVLTFERAGEIRVEVPVANPDQPRAVEAAAH